MQLTVMAAFILNQIDKYVCILDKSVGFKLRVTHYVI